MKRFLFSYSALLARYSLVLLGGTLFPGTAPGQDSGEEIVVLGSSKPVAMLPVNPRELLSFLPEGIEGWKMTRSTAENRYDEWLSSVAERRFERPRPDDPEGAVMKASIRIEDTGGFRQALGMFQDFAPTTGEGFEKKFIQENPAIIINYGAEDFEIHLLAEKRYIVRISCEYQPRRFSKEWLDRVDFSGISRIPKTQPVPLPEEITMVKFDELNDKKNRSYILATTLGERSDSEAIEDEDQLTTFGEQPTEPVAEEEEGDER